MRSTIKLTKRIVEAASTTGRRSLLWDNELRGFGVRIANSGTKTYFVRYRSKAPGAASARRFVVIGRHGIVTTEDARNKARALLSQAAIGEDPVIEREKQKAVSTVHTLVELFLTQHVRGKEKAWHISRLSIPFRQTHRSGDWIAQRRARNATEDIRASSENAQYTASGQ